jgi:hypothetical protein
MDKMQEELTSKTGEIPTRSVVTDNNEPRTRGKRSLEETEMREQGNDIRHRWTVQLASHDMKRPLHYDMHYNSFGHIYMTS